MVPVADGAGSSAWSFPTLKVNPNGGRFDTIVAGAAIADTDNADGSATLDVAVDGATIEISSDAVRVKAGGIGTTELANAGPGATGPVGSSSVIPVVTIDAKGRVTALTSASPQLDTVGAGTDIATNNVSTSKHGLAPKLPNDATKYFDGTGAYTVPPGASPAGDTQVWMPLTTVFAGEPVLVWDGDDNLIPTLTPL
jgi:hypothetical protein